MFYDLPVARPGAPGRPRTYGARLGNPAQLAAALQGEARTYTLNLYGGVSEVTAAERLVMLKTLHCQVRVVWVFRRTQWVALVTTDLALSVAQIIGFSGARWKIEAGFREIKQEIGSAETQTRHPDAVTNHLNFCLAATTLSWIYGAHLEKAPPRPMPPPSAPIMPSAICAAPSPRTSAPRVSVSIARATTKPREIP